MSTTIFRADDPDKTQVVMECVRPTPPHMAPLGPREKACLIAGMFMQNSVEVTCIYQVLNRWKLTPSQAFSIFELTQSVLLQYGCPVKPVTDFIKRLKGAARTVERPARSAETPKAAHPATRETQKIDPRKSTAAYYKDFLGYGNKTGEGSAPRVLVAEDDTICRENLSSRIRAAGNSVLAVSDGHEAVKALAHQDLDLVILDMKLPGVHGLEILKRLSKQNKRIPVIICTGFTEMETFPEVQSYGPIRCCPKPIDGNRVVRCIGDLLKKAG